MRVLVVDGMNLIRRVHAAVTATVSATEADDDGEATVSACTASLSKLLNRQQPSHAICVMDSPPPSWRHREFPDYKANRDPMPEQLSVILPRLEDAFRERGVRSVSEEGFEADDVIATIALRVSSSGGRVAIVSTDKSFCSLIREGVSVYDHFSDRYLDTEYVRQRFDVEPAQLVTFFALTGNASLNVPGVRSVGSRTAAALIHEHEDLDSILLAAETMKGKTGAMLRADRESARRARHLLSLRGDVELGSNLKDFRYRP